MSEKEIAKHIKGKLVKNSGRGMRKGDILKGRYVIDVKEVNKSFTLNRDVWAKVCSDAATYGWEYVPILLVDFPSHRLVIMDFDDFDRWCQDGSR